MTFKRVISSLLGLVLMLSLSVTPAFADHDDYYNDPTRVNKSRVLKNALVGAGIGAAIGGLASREGRRTNGMVKGAVIGGLGGAGYGYYRERQRIRDFEEYYGYRQPSGYYRPANYYYPQPGYYGNPYYYPY